MRTQDLWGLFRRHFGLGMAGLVIVTIIGALYYFVIYKKILKGQKRLNVKQILIGAMFVSYIIMVFGITFLNRGSHYQGSMNLHFLSSYRDAWNTFTLRSWQFLILNIILFIPLGFLLPLMSKNFKNFYRTLIIALLFTFIIEIIQYVTGLGIFEIDDIFNNIIGAIIGYGLIMFVINLKDKISLVRSLGYLAPLLITFIAFIGVFFVYEQKELGNMPMAYTHKIDMSHAKIDVNVVTDNDEKKVVIYKAPIYNAYEAKQMAIDFFERIDIDTAMLSVDAYNDNAYHWIRGEETYNLRIDFLGGSYSFGDLSSFDADLMDADVDQLISTLSSYGVTIPQNAELIHDDIGKYQWYVNMIEQGDTLIDGMITCTYFEDETIKNINNSLIRYEKVDQVRIKSENQALDDLTSGKFRYYNEEKIKSLIINDIGLEYTLDSKGYYRPVYKIESLINGENYLVFITAY